MRRVLLAVVAMGGCAAGLAQAPQRGPATSALKEGPLTVWVVTPANAEERARLADIAAAKRIATHAVAPGYKESTAGTFGRPASEVGQTAGSAGQTAGSFGRAASDVGQNAGSYGQTSSSSGKNASDTGQTAGSYGQTAGSFGQTSSTYGQTLSGASLAGSLKAAQAKAVIHNGAREALSGEVASFVTGQFESLQMTLVGVSSEELEEKLKAAEGTDAYPDLVLAKTLPPWWEARHVGLVMLGQPSFFDSDPPAPALRQNPAIEDWRLLWPTVLVNAPHPQRARAFVVWFRGGDCGACEPLWLAKDRTLADPAAVASRALQQVLMGDGLGGVADTEATTFSGNLARTLALMGGVGVPPGGLEYRVDVTGADQRGPFAVVTLRAILSSVEAFGVVHSQVVLRRDERRRWKVLHVSANVGMDRLGISSRELVRAANAVPRGSQSTDEAPKVMSVSLASPPDNDNRSPAPELWWDNSGAANLLVVEWQEQVGTAWTDPRLMYVPDREFRPETRVTASFAESGGAYRWRVWSLGRDGALALSEWRRFNIVR